MKVFIFDLDDTIIYYPHGIVDYSNIYPDATLFNLFDNLKYPKIIYTNGTHGHAINILKNMRLTDNILLISKKDT